MSKYLTLQQQAQEAFNQKNYALALELYDNCIKINPNDLDNYLAIILIYILLGEDEKITPFYLSLIYEGNFNEEELNQKLIKLLDFHLINKYQIGEIEIAKKLYLQLKELDENFSNSQLNLEDFFRKIINQVVFKLTNNNRHEEAIKEYENILMWYQNNDELWYLLSNSYLCQGEKEKALNAILAAIELAPESGKYYASYALIMKEMNNIEMAIKAYEKSLELDDTLIVSYNNLANIFRHCGLIDKAEFLYKKSLKINPNELLPYLNLGNIFMLKKQYDSAIEYFQKALLLKSQDSSILHHIGLAYQAKKEHQANLYFGFSQYFKGEYQEAISHFNKYLETELGDINLYSSLANCYFKLNDIPQGIDIYYKAMEQFPNDAKLFSSLMGVLQQLGKIKEALDIGEKALTKFPDNLMIIRGYQLILPILYNNIEEIDFYRHKFSKYLDILIEKTDLSTLEKIDQSVNLVSSTSNFFLQYQGKNDLDLQIKYAQYVQKIMVAKYPQFTEKLTINKNKTREKIRVGYISHFFKNHTIGKLYLGWIKNHNKHNFEVYCYYLGREIEPMTKQFDFYSSKFTIFNHNSIEEICQQIKEDQLDILVYPDIGMFPTVTLLSTLCLAPIQCASWGHPLTTGLPNIDYFISSELMEAENGEKYYSEKLIRLPNISIYYEKPMLPETRKNRSEFNLDSEKIVYLCCQSLFKYLPQYDYIFPEIVLKYLRQESLSLTPQFAFLSGYNLTPSLINIFKQRLEKAFNKYSLNYQDYCVIIPGLDQVNYAHLNLISDIYLDTISWSGGNTTLEAIACNLPIVTYPGEFMRGRHSYAMLRVLEITETIANSEQEYIDIAVKLGLDEEFRNQIKEKIKLNHHKLYNDLTCVQALEDFYIQSVKNYPEL